MVSNSRGIAGEPNPILSLSQAIENTSSGAYQTPQSFDTKNVTRLYRNVFTNQYFANSILDRTYQTTEKSGQWALENLKSAGRLVLFLSIITSISTYQHMSAYQGSLSENQKLTIVGQAVTTVLNDTSFWTGVAGLEVVGPLVTKPINMLILNTTGRTLFKQILQGLVGNVVLFVGFPYLTGLYEEACIYNRMFDLKRLKEKLNQQKINQTQYAEQSQMIENNFTSSKKLWSQLLNKEHRQLIFRNVQTMGLISWKNKHLQNIWLQKVMLHGILKGDLWITLLSVGGVTSAGMAAGVQGSAATFTLAIVGFILAILVPEDIKNNSTHDVQWFYRKFFGTLAGTVRKELLEGCFHRLKSENNFWETHACVRGSLKKMEDVRNKVIRSFLVEMETMFKTLINLDFQSVALEVYVSELKKTPTLKSTGSMHAIKSNSLALQLFHLKELLMSHLLTKSDNEMNITNALVTIYKNKLEVKKLYHRISGLIYDVLGMIQSDADFLERKIPELRTRAHMQLNPLSKDSLTHLKQIEEIMSQEAWFIKNHLKTLIQDGFSNQFFGHMRHHHVDESYLKTNISDIYQKHSSIETSNLNNLLGLFEFFKFNYYYESNVKEAISHLVWELGLNNFFSNLNPNTPQGEKSLGELAEKHGISKENLIDHIKKLNVSYN